MSTSARKHVFLEKTCFLPEHFSTLSGRLLIKVAGRPLKGLRLLIKVAGRPLKGLTGVYEKSTKKDPSMVWSVAFDEA